MSLRNQKIEPHLPASKECDYGISRSRYGFCHLVVDLTLTIPHLKCELHKPVYSMFTLCDWSCIPSKHIWQILTNNLKIISDSLYPFKLLILHIIDSNSNFGDGIQVGL